MPNTRNDCKSSLLKSKLFLSLLCCALFFCPMQAEAHMYSVIPNEFDVEAGSEHEVISSLTMHPLETQYSLRYFEEAFSSIGYDLNEVIIDGSFVYNDGTTTILPEFEEFDNPETTYMEDLGLTSKLDGYKSTATVEKSGTVIVESGMDAPFAMGFMMKMYSKHVLNLEADGGSMQEVGNGEWEEIVPLTDLAEAQLGEPIQFRVLLNGTPEANRTEIKYATEETDVVYNEGERSFTNLETLGDGTTDSNGIFEYTPQCYGTHTVVADMIEPINNVYYTSTFSFELKDPNAEESRSSTSGGGCNAGAGPAAILALLGLAFMPAVTRKFKKG